MSVHEFNYFYVSRNGVQEGPLSLSTIREKILDSYFLSQDYIYESKSNQWVPINAFEKTKDLFMSLDKQSEKHKSDDFNKWFVLKSSNQLGPYGYDEILQLINKKEIMDFDFVWNRKMTTWLKISECPEFREIKINGKAVNPVRRKFDRAEFVSTIIIHNNKKVWKARSFSIGVGGVRIEVENSQFSLGDEIFIHFKADLELPSFNATCEIVNLNNQTQSENSISVQIIGARFLKVNFVVQKIINDYVNRMNQWSVA